MSLENTMRTNQYKFLIQDIIDRVLNAKARLVRAEVDAGACRTRHDFDNLAKKRDEYETAYDSAVADLTGLILHGGGK